MTIEEVCLQPGLITEDYVLFSLNDAKLKAGDIVEFPLNRRLPDGSWGWLNGDPMIVRIKRDETASL